MAIVLINLLLGFALGYSMHRSRFCFAGAFRDFMLFKDGGLLKALLACLLCSTLLFAVVQFGVQYVTGELPGNFYPIGLYTIVGGILFGIGMVIAGGCVCSIFLRLGEGFKVFIFVLIGLVAGSMAGSVHYSWWQQTFTWFEPVFLGELLSWPLALLIQIAILGILYRYVVQIEEQGRRL